MVKYRKFVIAAALALTAFGSFLAYRSQRPASKAGIVDPRGIVNPDNGARGMTQEPMPQLSKKRFELPPSVGTGSYTEPKQQQTPKKDKEVD